jgi:hypothetical protein
MDRKARTKRRAPRLRKARPLLLAVGAAVALAGCGDDSTPPPPPDMATPSHDMLIFGVPVARDLAMPHD